METHDSSETRRLSAGTLIALAVLGLGILFVAVLVLELATGSRGPGEGAELLRSPRPLLPAGLPPFEVQDASDLAAGLESEYRQRRVPIESVEAATIGRSGEHEALVFAAVVAEAADPASEAFRANVLSGTTAALVPESSGDAAWSFRVVDGVVVYTTVTQEGPMYVWFFRDAFVQMSVVPSVSDRGDGMLRAILRVQRAASRSRAA